MQIFYLTSDNEKAIHQCAQLLYESFKDITSEAWPTMEDALQEVRESLADNRVSCVAIDNAGDVAGWIGGIQDYNGRTWELHPLVVKESLRRQGIGTALVKILETIAKANEATTIYLSTDDEDGRTSLSNKNLYPDVWQHIRTIKNSGGHPYEFYQKMGFVIVGVIPDANGLGKPDIFMAKRIG